MLRRRIFHRLECFLGRAVITPIATTEYQGAFRRLEPRLLIIDDEESICFSMSEYFSLHGYRVDAAQELDEAEKLIGSREYKVVIQDLRLALLVTLMVSTSSR